MSQRIEDIIEKYPRLKYKRWRDAGTFTIVTEPDIEGIARFIVNECIGIALRHSHRDDDMGAIIANKIKKEML